MTLRSIIATRHTLAQAAKCDQIRATRPQPCYARVPAWLKSLGDNHA